MTASPATPPTPVPTGALLDDLSCEFALHCTPDGTVRWADARSERTFGTALAGQALAVVVAPGAEEKAVRLVAAACAGRVTGWELLLVGADGPLVGTFRGAPHDGGALLVASIQQADHARLLAQMADSLNEITALHRETERQQRELLTANRALDDSARGMSTLYSELEEQGHTMRRADEVRARFVANVSHELRTPLNSILGLSKLLLSRADGELTSEQEKQLGFIRKSAETLSDLVNDMLDLAKAEAGKMTLRTARFDATELVGALRGMLRPLETSPDVALVIEDPTVASGEVAEIAFETDEAKLSQVLRNFVSNALKFTEQGEVRLTTHDNGDGTVTFAVKDTGVGIAPEDQARVFEEFTQLPNPLQGRVKGTGLGLSVSRGLAQLLGGRIDLASEPGTGSTFSLTVPKVHPDAAGLVALTERAQVLDPSRRPILVVEDDRQTLFLYEKYLEGSGYQVLPARSTEEARAVLERVRPAAMVLDVMLEGETTWHFLSEIKSDVRFRDIPTLVVTVTDREQKARALGADEFFVKPVERDWLLRKLRHLAKAGPMEKVLVIDDDEVSRYLVRKLLVDTSYTVIEASDGPEGLRMARDEQPHVIVLDFVMPLMTAFEVLDGLKADPKTRGIPVIVATSKTLDEQERQRLESDTAAVLSKQTLSKEIAIARIREALQKAVPV